MPDILLVEDTPFFADIIARRFARLTPYRVLRAGTMARAVELAQANEDRILAALVDLNLPDAPAGEAVDALAGLGLRVVVYTGTYDEDVRQAMLDKGVVDYVLKDNPDTLDTLVRLATRLEKNASTSVLVVDDSRASRHLLRVQLKRLAFRVLEAADGEEALALLDADPDIRLVITDYTMPGMDGFELARSIRRTRPREELAVIGISASGKKGVSARFMKHGASDFLHKPFCPEELACRVFQNLEMVEQIACVRGLDQAG